MWREGAVLTFRHFHGSRERGVSTRETASRELPTGSAVRMDSEPPSPDKSSACPFCGLLCDDLQIAFEGARATAARNACPKATQALAAVMASAKPSINGKAVALDDALEAAAGVLRKAQRPLLAGLGTDVAGMRAALALGERCGALLDHLHGVAMGRQLRVLQSRGLTLTTLSEVRNRADLVLLLGVDLNADFQRFVATCLAPEETLAPAHRQRRTVFHLGPKGTAPRDCPVPVTALPCPPGQLLEVFDVLRALASGRSARAAARTLRMLQPLLEAMASAAYTVVAWAPGQLPADSADLLIASACELVAEINKTRRAAGLSLGGNDGGQSALACSAWITGYPLPVSYAGEVLEHDPLRFETRRLLAAGEIDALLWLSSFSDRAPPQTALPRIVLGTAGTARPAANAICIPTGTPGIDHAGQLIRTDGVVALPVQALVDRKLPSSASVLDALRTRMD